MGTFPFFSLLWMEVEAFWTEFGAFWTEFGAFWTEIGAFWTVDFWTWAFLLESGAFSGALDVVGGRVRSLGGIVMLESRLNAVRAN